MKGASQILGLLAITLGAAAMIFFAQARPGYFTNVTYLGAIVLLEIVVAAVWHYEKAFFLVLMIAFLWAGTAVPLKEPASAARWVFLVVAALAGFIKWVQSDRKKHFGAIHLIAVLCVLSAAVSALASNRAQISLLKVSSLFLVFLYGSAGARLAVVGRETAFFRGLVLACEVMTYSSAVLYLAVHFEIFGNSNSLGAIMGVVVVPVLAWSVLIRSDHQVRLRPTLALCLAAYLLCSSISRASILSAGVTVAIMCVASHRRRILLKGTFVLVLLVSALAVFQPEHFGFLVSSLTSDIIYKGKPEEGLLGSRMSPWQETVAVIKQSPWFGSGFGTSDPLRDSSSSALDSNFRTSPGYGREHGNSYLALAEYVGLLGIVPFMALLVVVVHCIHRVSSWLWRTGNPYHYAVPLAFICLAGLIHAFFEDWLFAVGYYLTVFFWTAVFVLADLVPPRLPDEVALRNAWSVPAINASQVPLLPNQ